MFRKMYTVMLKYCSKLCTINILLNEFVFAFKYLKVIVIYFKTMLHLYEEVVYLINGLGTNSVSYYRKIDFE